MKVFKLYVSCSFSGRVEGIITAKDKYVAINKAKALMKRNIDATDYKYGKWTVIANEIETGLKFTK